MLLLVVGVAAPSISVTRPIAAELLALTAAVLLAPALLRRRKRAG